MASSGKFTWRITNFSGRQSESLIIYSDVFTVGGCNWRIRVHPKGNNNDDWLSVYLGVADAVGLPSGWCIVAKYSLTLVNQLRSHDSTTRVADSRPHREFKAPLCSSWGRRKFKRLAELRDSSKGYLVNDTLIVEAEIEVLNVSPPTVVLETFSRNLDKFITDVAQCRNSTESSSKDRLATSLESTPSVNMASFGKFTWRITNFSGQQSESRIFSDVFTVGGCKWRIRVHPKGTDNWLSVYLKVANARGLPIGWCIDANFNLTVVNQFQSHDSTTLDCPSHRFKFPLSRNWGWPKFKRLTELHDSRKGYLVNDTLIVEAEIEVLNVSPPTVLSGTFLSNQDNFITDAAQARTTESSSNGGLKMAKQSLKECLSDILKLNIKDRLATSLETLTLTQAEIGLSSEQQRAVELFWNDFDNFVADFVAFEQENSEFELHKLAKDQTFRSIKNHHESHVSNKQRLDDLTKKEKECKKKMEKAMKRMEEAKKGMEEANSEKAKLIADWQTLMTESEETKSEYMALDRKVDEAEERKRIAGERMSRSIAAWSSLKAHFDN